MENHVASMVDAKGEQMSDTKAICSNTHAYFCMDDDKQDLPAQLFEAIRVLAERIEGTASILTMLEERADGGAWSRRR